jgi:DNA-binding MarR family transcriptional regulator
MQKCERSVIHQNSLTPSHSPPTTRRSFALTNDRCRSYLGPMTIDAAVTTVQLTYPQVYHACHTRHQRKRTTEHALSARDAAILAHCSVESPMPPAKLARHLSIARSTLSEAVKKLTQAGYVRRVAQLDGDGRQSGILLTAKGLHAVRETSVLESARLAAVLAEASASDRAAIALGLSKLAEACRRYAERSSPRVGGSVS